MKAQAAIYARISEDRELDELGVKRQLKDCRALAAKKGWNVVREYVDNDTSAYKRTVRAEYRQMLADIAAGVVKAVVVYNEDRLHRQPRELEEFFDICDAAGLTSLASVAGDIDLSTSDGKMMARVKGAVAAKESDDKSRRIQRKHQELAENGKVSGGGTRPFGFEDDKRTIRAVEAKIIRDAAKRVLRGETVRSICADLNDRGVKTSAGNRWHTNTLRRILISGRISGQRDYKSEIISKADWPAIIPPADTTRLRALLKDPNRRKNGRARSYMLAGMLRCGKCEANLVSRPTENGRRRYICAKGPGFNGCNGTMIVADELEELVSEMVFFRFDGPDLARAIAAQAVGNEDDHQNEVDAASAQLEELAAMYGQGKIAVGEWIAARTPIEERLNAAKNALANATGTGAVSEFVGDMDALRGSWPDMPLSRKREIISTLLEFAVINPGRRGYNKFDPGRVGPVWRI